MCHYPHPTAASRETWNAGRDLRKLWIYNRTHVDNTFGPVDWTTYKRGQVDKLFVEFKKWLRNEMSDQERTPMCQDAFNDDVKLWLNDEDAPLDQRENLLHPPREPVA